MSLFMVTLLTFFRFPADRSRAFFKVFSKAWPCEFSDSRKPIDDRPVLEGLIEFLHLSGEKPHGDVHELFMESYEDDLTSVDVRNVIRYLQINTSHGHTDSSQASKRGHAWLDDRTFDRVVPQELSGPVSTVAIENDSLQPRQMSHLIDSTAMANILSPLSEPLEASNNEYDNTNATANVMETSSHTGHNTRDSFLDQQRVRSPRHYPAPLTAGKLHGYLKERQFDHIRYLDADRRLIYIADPDASYLSVLIRTARAYQQRSLQDSICKYFAQDTSIRISISEGCTEYQMEFHIPYLAMRYRPPQGFPETKDRIHCRCMNIDFLDTNSADASPDGICGVYRAQISLTVCGTDNSRWSVYCLEDRYFDGDGEIGEDEQTDDHQADQIARGAFGAEDVILDPREYFIRVFLLRMSQVYTERVNLVRRIESGIQDHSWGRYFFCTTRDGIPSAIHDTATSDWIDPTLELIGILRNDVANMNDAWVRFTSETGDAAYLLDTPSNPNIVTTMSKLNDVFNQMLVLEQKLRRMAEQCEKRAQTVNLRLAIDSKRSAELTVYFISPLAVVSTFFAIPVPIIDFPRNIFSFSVAIVLYTIVLQAVLFFWGGRLSQQRWWIKMLRRAKALRDGDPGFTKKNTAGVTVLQRKATASCIV
jgi:hypothetical protein